MVAENSSQYFVFFYCKKYHIHVIMRYFTVVLRCYEKQLICSQFLQNITVDVTLFRRCRMFPRLQTWMFFTFTEADKEPQTLNIITPSLHYCENNCTQLILSLKHLNLKPQSVLKMQQNTCFLPWRLKIKSLTVAASSSPLSVCFPELIFSSSLWRLYRSSLCVVLTAPINGGIWLSIEEEKNRGHCPQHLLPSLLLPLHTTSYWTNKF